MTEHKSFKRLVRARMQKTGESYTAARAKLLAGEPSHHEEKAPLATSDEAIRERTGRGWEEWFDLLDEWGAREMSHRDIGRRLAEELGVEPLAWNAQAITTSYERARRGRAVGERGDGFTVTSSKTVAVPVERLYDAFVDAALRGRWLHDGELRERTATRPKSARFNWYDGDTRVNAVFESKGAARSAVALEHTRLADVPERDRMKGYWRERMSALKSVLEAEEGTRV